MQYSLDLSAPVDENGQGGLIAWSPAEFIPLWPTRQLVQATKNRGLGKGVGERESQTPVRFTGRHACLSERTHDAYLERQGAIPAHSEVDRESVALIGLGVKRPFIIVELAEETETIGWQQAGNFHTCRLQSTAELVVTIFDLHVLVVSARVSVE
jgi:hypothetical protein